MVQDFEHLWNLPSTVILKISFFLTSKYQQLTGRAALWKFSACFLFWSSSQWHASNYTRIVSNTGSVSLLESQPLTCLLPSEQCCYSQEERYTFSLKNASGVDLYMALIHLEVPQIFLYFVDAEKNTAAAKRACVLYIPVILSIKIKWLPFYVVDSTFTEQSLTALYFKEKFFHSSIKRQGN